jgi:exodeoxyribonuclease VII large subunit
MRCGQKTRPQNLALRFSSGEIGYQMRLYHLPLLGKTTPSPYIRKMARESSDLAPLPMDEIDTLAGGNVVEYTVSEISSAIKRTMEDTFSHVRVRGELGRISRPASGHIYLDLKDERSVIGGVIWRGTATRLSFRPEEGLEVIVTGRITTYPGSSKYQIVIETIEPAGVGALMALLEERKRKLAAEGLFDETKKRSLPFLPRVIGIITSPSGAVIRDMLHGFAERFPSHVIVWPVRVQGETCASEVAAAIRGFNSMAPGGPIPRPDVLIVARGGGSLEDLWGFNEEIAVRAAAQSDIPLISAVGHETDWTLIDLAADARAPTPTKAAEWAVPKRTELIARNAELAARLGVVIHRSLDGLRRELRAAVRGLPRLGDLLSLPRQRFDTAAIRLARARQAYASAQRAAFSAWAARLRPALLGTRLERDQGRLATAVAGVRRSYAAVLRQQRNLAERASLRLVTRLLNQRAEKATERLHAAVPRLRRALMLGVRRERSRLDASAQLLAALSHKRVLERGFALIHTPDGAMVRKISSAKAHERLIIEFADGRLGARPELDAQPLRKGQSETKVRPRAKKQGDLF